MVEEVLRDCVGHHRTGGFITYGLFETSLYFFENFAREGTPVNGLLPDRFSLLTIPCSTRAFRDNHRHQPTPSPRTGHE